jgi:hypothetical protein
MADEDRQIAEHACEGKSARPVDDEVESYIPFQHRARVRECGPASNAVHPAAWDEGMDLLKWARPAEPDLNEREMNFLGRFARAYLRTD